MITVLDRPLYMYSDGSVLFVFIKSSCINFKCVIRCTSPSADGSSVCKLRSRNFSTVLGRAESILSENFGWTCCIPATNSQNRVICGVYVDFNEDVILGMGCKNVHIFCSNWLTDFVHHLKWLYKTFLSMYAVEKTILPIQRSPEVKESPKKGEIEHFSSLCKIEK